MRDLADTSHILRRDEGRLGIYFLETGANQRGSNVIYDRAGSAVSLAEPLLLIIMAISVGLMVVGMVLPIFTIQDYIK